MISRRGLSLFVFVLAMCMVASAHALTPGQAHAIATGDSDSRIAALQAALTAGDERVPVLVGALLEGAVKVDAERAYIVRGEEVVEAATGEAATLPDDAEDAINNNRMRGELEAALAALRLFSEDLSERRAALGTLVGSIDESKLPLLDKALAAETDASLRAEIELGMEGAATVGWGL